jgi:hypothetical protein
MKEVRMEIIMKIPYLLAILAALVTGIISIADGADINMASIRMIIAMVVFYIIGMVLSSTLKGIVEEQEKIKLEAEKKLREEERFAAIEKLKREQHLGTNLDLVADNDIDDEFTPLDFTQAVRTKMME